MRVLSLGAGVQSSTLLLMMCEGEIEPADVAIFADTQWEPRAVYRWLDGVLKPAAQENEIPLYCVSNGHIYNDARDPDSRFCSIPFFTEKPDGSPGMARRQCTHEYKIKPIRRKIRELIKRERVDLLIGITIDESHRARDSQVQYIHNTYPLLFEEPTSRAGCMAWLEDRGHRAPRSACIGCPYHSNSEWLNLKQRNPQEWEEAVSFDHELRDPKYRHTKRFKGRLFLHQQRVPLDEVNLGEDQLDFWGNECEGMCGV